MQNYENELTMSEERRGFESSEYIKMLRRRADELLHPPVDATTDTMSTPSLDTSDEIPPPA